MSDTFSFPDFNDPKFPEKLKKLRVDILGLSRREFEKKADLSFNAIEKFELRTTKGFRKPEKDVYEAMKKFATSYYYTYIHKSEKRDFSNLVYMFKTVWVKEAYDPSKPPEKKRSFKPTTEIEQ